MRFSLAAFVIAFVLVTTFAPRIAYAQTATTWTESWAGTSGWTTVTQSCFTTSGGKANATCQSGGLLSVKKWDVTKPITATIRMSGKPAVGSSTTDYFVGLTLWQREISPNQSNYVEIAQTRHVPPFTANNNHRIVGLASDKTSGIWQAKPYVFYAPPSYNPQPGAMYSYKLEWLPSQTRWNAYWQGLGPKWNNRQPFVPNLPIRIMLLCVSVGENTPNNGSSATCQFEPLTVTGVQV